MSKPDHITVDIEPTNRCNADCYFCPRDQTPHQGLMSDEVFDQALQRTIALREISLARLDLDVAISLCGLGEPLLNKRVPRFVEAASSEGFRVSVSSNGALLDERRSKALLDAGVQHVDLNVGEIGENYDDIYKLPWETTRDNVLRFKELAGDRCSIQIILVDHRDDADAVQVAEQYWRAHGFTSFFSFWLNNRGGALSADVVDHGPLADTTAASGMMADLGLEPLCAWPLTSMFVGYDGNYYLCCSDWKKEVAVGHVAEDGFVDVIRQKLEVASARRSICQTCNVDPTNLLASSLDPQGQPKDQSLTHFHLSQIEEDSARARSWSGALFPGSASDLPTPEVPSRKRIPVVGL